MKRDKFFYLHADGKDVDRNSEFNGDHYIFYDLNIILNISRLELSDENRKLDDLIKMVSKVERSWAQYDTAFLESYTKGFSRSLDAVKDKIVSTPFEMSDYFLRYGIKSWVKDFASMGDFLDLYKSSLHYNFILLSLAKAAVILIEGNKINAKPIENMKDFIQWYDKTLGLKLAIVIRVVLRIFYESSYDVGVRSLIKKPKNDIIKSIRSSACDIWHIYHFLYRVRNLKDFDIKKAIFITDDEEMSIIIKSLNIMGILGLDVESRLAFDNLFAGLEIPESDIEAIHQWSSKIGEKRSVSRREISRCVEAQIEELELIYKSSRLPWQTH